MKRQLKFSKPIKKWKPNLIQRWLIRLKIIKDRRIQANKDFLLDEHMINWNELDNSIKWEPTNKQSYDGRGPFRFLEDEIGHYPFYRHGVDPYEKENQE